MDAKKTRYGADDLDEVLGDATRLVVAKGKKVVDLSLKDAPESEELAKLMLGPSGNLRAPTAKRGKTILVGFNEEAYTDVLG